MIEIKRCNSIINIRKCLKFKTFIFTLLSVAIILSVQFAAAAQSPVNLGTANGFTILSKSGITDVPISAIIGNIGATPITGAAIGVTCSEMTGTIYDNDGGYTGGGGGSTLCRVTDAALLNTARIDMEAAYTNAANLISPDHTGLGSGDISGMTLLPGLYKWTSGLLINTGTTPDTSGVTLDCQGNTSAVFIFQIGQGLTVGSAAVVTLKNGCQAKNIFWVVAGTTALGTTSVFNGNILDKTDITLNTGAALCGRALAQTDVTLNKNHVSSICGGINSTNPVLANVTLVPKSANLTVGSTLQLNGTCLDQFGLPINVSVSYSSSNLSVATVNSTSGLVTAVGSGNVTINAVCGIGVSTTSKITVETEEGSKGVPVMGDNLFILLIISTLILGLYYGFKKYSR
jgi:hypothetical protein